MAAVNDAPTTSSVVLAHIAEDSGARLITSLELLAAAEDEDGDLLTVNNLQISSGAGQLVDNHDGTWTYTPAPDDDTAVTFSYSISDGTTSTAGTATLDIIPVDDTAPNQPPVVTAPLSLDVVEDGELLVLDLLQGATDPNGDALVITTGTITVNGQQTETPPPGFAPVSKTVLGFDPSAYDFLAEGEVFTITLNYTIADGNGSSVNQVATITITGTNDAAVITGDVSQTVAEANAALTITGTLASADDDNLDNSFVAQTDVVGTRGTFSITEAGAWTFVANSAFNELNVGDQVQETFNVTSIDGTPATVTVTITGTNDAAVITGDVSQTAAEANAALTITGTLASADDDNLDNSFVAQTDVVGTRGTFSITEAGAWTFVANSAFNELNVGDQVQETFNVTSIDGTPATVTVTITGTNDAAVITGDVSQTAAEANAALTITGTLASADDDNLDNSFVAQTDVVGTRGTFSITEAGVWTFVANSAFNELNVGDQVQETFNVTSIDGTPATVTVTITGTNDAAVITGDVSQTAAEANAALTITGTLASADDDNLDNSFVAQTDVVGTRGTFSITEAGVWTFVANSAFNELNVGDQVQETFNVTSIDGTPATVTVTITGTNDAAVITGDVSQTAAEANAALTITGTLASADDDNLDNSFVAQTDVVGTRGTFSITEAGVWTFVANSAFNELNVGDQVQETFNVTSIDGTPATVTVTITGTNDAAVITGDVSQTAAEANAALTITGTLASADDDNLDNSFVAQTDVVGTRGTFSITEAGVWTFVANSAFNELNVGDQVQETFNVTSIDGTPATVTVTITGTNDAAVITGDVSQTAAEANAALTITGTLASADDDNLDNSFVAQTDVVGTRGTFSITEAGVWTFVANSAFNELNVGDQVQETFNVTSIDGTPATVTVTITGTNDAAVITGDVSQTAAEANAALTITGTLASADDDNLDNSFVAQTDVVGTRGTFSITEAGVWTFVANSAFNELNVGDQVQETFNVTSIDGTPATVTVTITGTNDAAVITGDVSQTAAEANAALTITGTLASADDDNLDNSFVAQTDVVGTRGTFSITEAGVWTFVANSAFNELNVGDQVQETFNVTSIDGTPATVTVTITGTNDAAVITGDVSQTAAEANAALTITGTLASADDDNLDNSFVAQTDVVGTRGTFSITEAGVWTFVANSAFNELNVGDQVQETFNVTSIDGTPATVTVTITGTNDAAVITGDVSQTAAEANAALTITGTLASADDDNLDNSFVAQTDVVGTRGTFSITEAGVWTFVANSAFNELNVGDQVQETFNVTSIDGTPATVTVTITGTNDAAVITGDVSQTAAEANAALTITGTLASADDDNLDNSFVAQTDVVGTRGTFSITEAGVWTFVANSAFNELNVGDQVQETFNVTSIDGTPATVTVTITGTNDAAVITGDVSQTAAEANAALTITGTLASADDDNLDNSFVAQTDVVGTRGTFSITEAGVWTFVANSAFNELNVGDQVQETFNVTSIDGTPATVTVTITGTNDAAVITGDVSQTAAEANAALTITGTLASADDDNLDNSFVAQTDVVGTRGTFSITEAGVWTFVANSAFNELNVGDQVQETFNVTSIDGTPATVTVTITGTNDAAVITGDVSQTVAEANAALTITGTLASADDDNLDNSFVAQTDVVGTRGTFSITEAGVWTFVANSAFNELNVGDQVQETFNVTSIDGTPATVTVTITGTDDVPVLKGDIEGAVTEDVANLEGSLFATGSLTITDVDNDVAEYAFDEAVVSSQGALGSLTINAEGHWTYSVANALLQYLKQGQEKVETFTVTANGGFSQDITVTVTGTNDVPNITGAVTGAVQEDTDIAFGTLLTTTGLLSITDADAGEAFFQTSVTPVGSVLGNLAITNQGAWSYSVTNSLVQYLNQGEARDEQFTVLSLDGTPTVITVTITGTNDVPVISFVVGNATGAVTEDTTQTVSGVLTATDVDDTAELTWSIDESEGTYGSLSLAGNSGSWTYTLANGSNGTENAVQSLKQGETVTDSFTVIVTDEFGATDEQTVTVTITGTNDAPVIAVGGDTASIIEDDGNTVTGTLTATDIDNDSELNWSIEGSVSGIATGTYGSLTQVGGVWTYTLNNAAENVQALNQGQQVTDTFTVIATDEFGATDEQVVTVTITGTNDAPIIAEGGAAGSIREDDAELTVTGTLIASDVDTGAELIWSIEGEDQEGTAAGTYGALTQVDGVWTYTLNNTAANVQALAQGQEVFDTFTVIVSDGLGGTDTQTVTVTVTGTNDAPVINAIAPVALHEQSNTEALTTSINVAFTDIDLTDVGHSASIATASASGVTHPNLTEEALKTLIRVGDVSKASGSTAGSLSLGFSAASGVFDYLAAGETVTLNYTLEVDDSDIAGSTTKDFSITITGTNDSPVVLDSSVVIGTVTERDDGAINENSGNLTVTGTIGFNDVDLSDILHGAEISVAPVGDEVLGTLILNGIEGFDAVSQDANTVGWVFSVNAGQLDKLKAGEILTQEYIVRISDVGGGFVDQTVTITIVGTNDAPIVTLNSSSAVLTEDTSAVPVDSVLTLSASGTLSYSDVDLGITDGETPAVADSHTIADSLQTAVWTGGESNALSQPQLDALEAAFTTSINTANKTGIWNFALANDAVQFLGEGETLTLTYSVAVTDSSGALTNTDSETVTITLTGTNDTPVLVVTPPSAGLVEDAVVGEAAVLTATFNVAVTDLDVNDEHTVDVWTGPFLFNGQPVDGQHQLYSKIVAAVDSGTAQPVNGDVGDWTFSISNAAVQFLGADETLTIRLLVNATDSGTNGAAVTQFVDIVITGTNDAPVIEAETVLAANLTEDALAPEDDLGTVVNEATHLLATGDVVFSDLDVNDEHVVALQLEADGITYSAGPLDADALLAIEGAIAVSANTAGWNFAIANSAVQFLAAGETLTLTYVLSVTDDSGVVLNNTATETVTITITGTNDQPSLVVGSATVSFTEDTAVDGLLSATGALTVTDVDLTDTHEIEFALASATVEGDALTGEALAAIEAAITTGTDDNEGLDWTIDIANSAVQFLAAGEELVLTFNVTAVDDSATVNATSEVQTITITVIGTNDQPTIVVGSTDAGAEVAERLDGSDGENDGDLTDTGTITFADVDLSDTHTATVGLTVRDGEGSEVVAPLGELTLGAVNPVTNSVDWTFTLAAGAIDTLAEGETLTQFYAVTVDDGNGSSVTQDITVTITGTNDAPTIVGGSTDAIGAVTEKVDGALDENTGDLTDTGMITFADVDLSDEHSASITAAVATDGANNSVPARGTLTLGAVDQGTNSLTWTYSVAAGALDNLGAGETLTQVYTVTINDSKTGGTVTQDVTITLIGTNDAPIISTGNLQVVALVDGTVPAFSLADKVSIGDVDANDMLTVNLKAVMGTLSSGSESEFQFSDDGEGGLQLSGTAQKINAAIATLMFTPDSELGAGAALFVEVTDSDGATDDAYVDFVVVDEEAGEPVELDTTLDFAAGVTGQFANYTTDTIITIEGVSASQIEHQVEVEFGTLIQYTATDSLLILEGFTGDLDGNSILFADGSVLKTSSVKATLVGSAVDGGDYLKGSDFNDVLRGMAGDDKLEGGAGNDTMYGGTGGDIIFGGAGNDILYAGDTTANDVAQDLFVYNLEGGYQGTDLIIGFADGQDKIGFDGASMANVVIAANVGSTAVVKLYADIEHTEELATIKLLGMAGNVSIDDFNFGVVPA
ncbi:VCBS domain-containing protein [Stutzerimonas kunmingensis]|uniref:VCBS domain-containing protein n=1 Tax=Stutzerimonas kunmingensis TaxID=1211807 RepID=UPI0035CF5533